LLSTAGWYIAAALKVSCVALEWLPAYAPKLNPVEQNWNYSKLSNFIPDDIEYLANMLDASFSHQSKRQNLLRSFFHCAKLKI